MSAVGVGAEVGVGVGVAFGSGVCPAGVGVGVGVGVAVGVGVGVSVGVGVGAAVGDGVGVAAVPEMATPLTEPVRMVKTAELATLRLPSPSPITLDRNGVSMWNEQVRVTWTRWPTSYVPRKAGAGSVPGSVQSMPVASLFISVL